MMQIVYTQKHNIYYLSRVRGRDYSLIEKGGTHKMTTGEYKTESPM